MMTFQPPTTKPVLPPLLKIREAAKMLNVSKTSIQALIDNGDLFASKINPSRKKQKRYHHRITRESFEIFYRKRFGHDIERDLQPVSTPKI